MRFSCRPGSLREGFGCCVCWVVAVCMCSTESIAGDKREEAGPGRVRWTGSTLRGTPDQAAPYSVEPAFPALKFVNPIVMAHANGTGRLFVGELGGRILSFKNEPASQKWDVAIDLKTRHPNLTALYGLAFPEDFPRTRFAYVFYVLKNDLPDGTVISRFKVRQTDPPTFDADSEEVIIRFWSGGHNGRLPGVRE